MCGETEGRKPVGEEIEEGRDSARERKVEKERKHEGEVKIEKGVWEEIKKRKRTAISKLIAGENFDN